ncbi:MAG: tRNA pseudouridine(13) synthase TruD [Planctomycetes bacterium]|nr:tRNA pseudouridine(13) synthase TruD [Planctomycetota bacterium]
MTEAELARCEASRARASSRRAARCSGTRALLADGRPGDDERAVRAELGADPAALAGLLPGLAPEGARRPLLAWPREARVEAHPAGARLAFRLGPGSYATVLVAALEAAAAGPPGEGPLAATVSTGAGPMDPAESEDA